MILEVKYLVFLHVFYYNIGVVGGMAYNKHYHFSALAMKLYLNAVQFFCLDVLSTYFSRFQEIQKAKIVIGYNDGFVKR